MSDAVEQVEEVCPKVVPNIQKWFYWNKGGRNIYVIGNKEIDKYFMVPEESADMLYDIILRMNGEYNISDISHYAEEKYKMIVPISDLLKKLRRAGLLQGHEAEKVNELELFSKKLYSYEYKEYSKKKKERMTHLWNVLFTLTVAVVICAAVTLIIKPEDCKEYYGKSFLYKNSYIYGALLSCLISWINIICHEFAHAITSVKFGLQPNEFAMILYGGYKFEWLVKIKGMYTVKRKYRIYIMSAGIATNLALLSLSLVIGMWLPLSDTATQILSKLMVTNIFMIVACISPFTISDGYYVVTQILKTSNLRRQTFRMLNMKNWKKEKPSLLNIGYCLVSVGMIIYSFTITFIWGKNISVEVYESTASSIDVAFLRYLVAAIPLIIVIGVIGFFAKRFVRLIRAN